MNRLVLILVLVAAIVLSVTPLWAVGENAITAAGGRVAQVFVTNWPLVQQIQEQNKDAGGNIRVHEQGTAAVQGSVEVSNLPVDGNGNVRVAESSILQSKVATIVDRQTVAGGSSFVSEPVFVGDYREVSLMVKVESEDQPSGALWLRFSSSPGGPSVQPEAAGGNWPAPDGLGGLFPAKQFPIFGPYLTAVLSNRQPDSATTIVTVDAYLTR